VCGRRRERGQQNEEANDASATHKGKGVCSLADSFFGAKVWSRRSENELCPDLRGARSTLRKKWVARGDIGRLRVRGEAGIREVIYLGLRNRNASRERVEIGVVQKVEDLEA